MTALIPTDAEDTGLLREALLRALDEGPALGFGMLADAPAEVDDGIAAVIATSGSSGVPKRVALSGEALRASAASTAARIGSGRWLLALPAGYVAGLQVMVRSILAGTEPTRIEGRFTPRAFAEASRSMLHATTAGVLPTLYTSLVPAQIATLLDATGEPGVLAALQAYEAILVGARRSRSRCGSGRPTSGCVSCGPTARRRPVAAVCTTASRSTP